MYTETFQGGMYHHITNATRPWMSAHIYSPSEGNFAYLYPNLKHLIADEFGMLAEFEVDKVAIPKKDIEMIALFVEKGAYKFKDIKITYGTTF